MEKKIYGLSMQEVEEKRKKGEGEQEPESITKSKKQIIRENVLTLFNLLNFIIAGLLFAVGAYTNMIFIAIIILNIVIGIAQECKAKKLVDELSILNRPAIKVRREGEDQEIELKDIVKGDIVILESGSQICNDSIVTSGSLEVNESLLTGESDPVIKEVGSTLYSGSSVISGKACAEVIHVGNDNYATSLVNEVKKEKQVQSELLGSMRKVTRFTSSLIIPLGILLFLEAFVLRKAPVNESVVASAAALLGMLPKGLVLLISVSLATGVIRLAKMKILVQNIYSLETLAHVDVLCLDKTGTITVPEMEVAQFILAKDQEADQQSEDKNKIAKLLSDCVRALPCDNATMEALQQYFTEPMENSAEKIVPFSSATKYSGVVLAGKAYVVGAPEFVLRQDYAAVQGTIEVFLEKGYRVLVFAEYEGNLDGKELTENATPIAFILLNNAIREGAMDTFRYFSKRGVEVKVISGDNPVTVSEIAKKAGIRHAEKQVDAATLKTAEAVRKAAKKYTVFGRVTPEQKRLLVQALKEQGKTVAMTGDGVNDILALKDADCSIAMASGSEAASHVAQLVLLDNDFNKMPAVVMEGRRVVNNIGRTASLYLVKNIFSMLLAVFSMLFLIDYPLEPSQVSLISVFTIGIPSFFLALEQNRNQIHGHFLTNVLIQALPAGITDFIVVSGLVIFCREFGVEKECVSTSCTILIAVVGFMILYHIAKPMTTPHAILIAAMVIGWLFCMLFFSELFAITAVTGKCAMLMIVFAVITEPVFRYLIQLVETVQKWGGKLKF